MILRDYRCQECGWEFEAEVERGEVAWEVECPKCGSDDTVRLWRVPAVIYRGSGWYNKDVKTMEAKS